MITYATNEKILFSQDAFGMHLATSKLFSDENDRSILEHEVKKYFANILLHLSPQVASTIAALPKLNLDIQVVAPDHGPLWRTQEEIAYVIDLYQKFAAQEPKKKAVVFYNTMWTSTGKMANALADGLRDSGVQVQVIDINVSDRSEIITEIIDAAIVCAGAPTMNNQVYPAMADILTYVKGLRPKNKIGFAFGSFGWSGEGHKYIHSEMESMKFNLPFPPYSCKYMPTEKNLEEIFNIGKSLAESINN
jgi:flavorubredoxin